MVIIRGNSMDSGRGVARESIPPVMGRAPGGLVARSSNLIFRDDGGPHALSGIKPAIPLSLPVFRIDAWNAPAGILHGRNVDEACPVTFANPGEMPLPG